MASFVSAQVVLLPQATASGTYSVYAEIKGNGEVVSINDIASSQNVPLALVSDSITEVDVSGVLGTLDATSAGHDKVSLFFYAPASLFDVVQVLGLRFVYGPTPIPGSALADDAVDSMKVAHGSLTGDRREPSVAAGTWSPSPPRSGSTSTRAVPRSSTTGGAPLR